MSNKLQIFIINDIENNKTVKMSFIMINQNFKNIIKITYFGVFNFSFRKKKEKKKHFFFFLKKNKIK